MKTEPRSQDTAPAPSHPPLSRRSLTPVLSALTALAALAIDMSLPAQARLQSVFTADAAQVQLTLTLFLAGYAVGQFVCGPLADHFGRRPVLLGGLLLFTLSGFACAFSASLAALTVLRLVQGAGASVGPVLSRAMVRDLFTHREAAGVLSHITQVMVLAPIVAPILGGYLLAGFGWRSIFLVLGAWGAAAALACWWRLPETLPPGERAPTYALFGASLRSYRIIITTRESLPFILATCAAFGGLFAYVSGSPFVFAEVYGISQAHFGYYFAVPALALMAGAAVNRVLLRRCEPELLLRIGAGLLLLAGGILLALLRAGQGSVVALLGPLMLYMFGLGLVGPNATALALKYHGARAGAASSLMGAFQTMAGALSGLVVGMFYNGTPASLVVTVAVCSMLSFGASLVRGTGKGASAA